MASFKIILNCCCFYRNCRQYQTYVNIKICRHIVVGQCNDCRHLQTFPLAGNRFDCLGYFGQCCKRGQFAFPIIHLKRSNMFSLKLRKIIYADAFFSAPCLRYPHILVSQSKFLLYLTHEHHIDLTGCFLWSKHKSNANNMTTNMATNKKHPVYC